MVFTFGFQTLFLFLVKKFKSTGTLHYLFTKHHLNPHPVISCLSSAMLTRPAEIWNPSGMPVRSWLPPLGDKVPSCYTWTMVLIQVSFLATEERTLLNTMYYFATTGFANRYGLVLSRQIAAQFQNLQGSWAVDGCVCVNF
ncbi:hypothetical protein VTK26DRAFT_1849 [Humicola hyalothermophila]